MSVPADIAAERVRGLLGSVRYGRSLDVRDVTRSTNDDAREAALRGAERGHAVVADHQQAGRGSQGRSWSSPAGLDLYVSVVDRPALAISALPPLTLAVGLGVAEAVDALLGAGGASAPAAAQVKWPNDVWLTGKKCAGVLVEASSQGLELQSLVIGIGLNVNRAAFEGELAASATSLRQVRGGAEALDRGEALALLLTHVERRVDRFVAEGPSGLVDALQTRLAMRDERVRCAELEGRLVGVSREGAALIETAHGVREAFSGRLERA